MEDNNNQMLKEIKTFQSEFDKEKNTNLNFNIKTKELLEECNINIDLKCKSFCQFYNSFLIYK